MIGTLSSVASGVGEGVGGMSSIPITAAIALMLCAPPSVRATYGVYRALSVVALDDSLVVATVALITVPVLVVLASEVLVPRCLHTHVADASDRFQALLPLVAPYGHVTPVEVDHALG